MIFLLESQLNVNQAISFHEEELKLTFFPNILEQFFGGNDDADGMVNYLASHGRNGC